jgi:hypothetical protein
MSVDDAAAPSVHDLLLALAGRLDDDLLAWARELLAVGEHDQAVELATAALAAEQVVLPPPLRSALVAAARAAHTDLDVERALPPAAPEHGTPHRFDAAAAPGDAVITAVRAVPGRRLAGCTVHLTWRRTPAGAAPGPLPRAVVLVEADPERSPEVLAYLLATELDRAGAPASVEVFTAGARLPAYHEAALRDAREMAGGEAGDPPPARHGTEGAQPGRSTTSGPEHGEPSAGRRSGGRRRRAEPAVDQAPEAAPVPPEPAPRPSVADPLSGPLREPLLAPLLDPTEPAAEPEPGPVGRQLPPAGPHPPEAEPVASEGVEEPPGQAGFVPTDVPEPREVPEEWVVDWRSGEWAMPRTPPPDGPSDDPAEAPGPGPTDAGSGPPRPGERTGRIPRDPASGPMPLGPPRVDLPPAVSGEVSLFESPTARVGPVSGPRPGGEQPRTGQPDLPRPETPPRPVTRPWPDRSRAFPLRDEPPQEVPLFGEAPGAERRPDGARPGRRRRPDDDVPPASAPTEAAPGFPPADSEPSVLLGGSERDLLARLQSELAARERRPRPYRRAGQNGSAHSVNGHGHGPDDDRPPDLAG